MLEAWLLSGLLEGNASGEEASVRILFETEAGASGVRCSASGISASLRGAGVDMMAVRTHARTVELGL
jgi:hypothetical protein